MEAIGTLIPGMYLTTLDIEVLVLLQAEVFGLLASRYGWPGQHELDPPLTCWLGFQQALIIKKWHCSRNPLGEIYIIIEGQAV